MKNINLNPGGLIGAVLCGGVAVAVIFGMTEASEINEGRGGRGVGKLVIIAVVAGAFAGNFLWSAIFPKSDG